MKPIGERIKFQRELQEMSQEELAEKSGIKQPSLSDIESGITKKPRNPTLIAIARALNNNLEESWLDEHLTITQTLPNITNIKAEDLINSLTFPSNEKISKAKAELIRKAKNLDKEIEKIKKMSQ